MTEVLEKLQAYFRGQIDGKATAPADSKEGGEPVRWKELSDNQRDAIAKKTAEIMQDPRVAQNVGRVSEAVRVQEAITKRNKDPKTGETKPMSDADEQAYANADQAIVRWGGAAVSAVGKHIADLADPERGAILKLIISSAHDANNGLQKLMIPAPTQQDKPRDKLGAADLVPASVVGGLREVQLSESNLAFGGAKISGTRQI
jgi:hypothetical protein